MTASSHYRLSQMACQLGAS